MRYFSMLLSAPVGGGLAQPLATITIFDDEDPPNSTVSFTKPKFVVGESSEYVELTLKRESLSGGAVPSSYAYGYVQIRPETARPGEDYWNSGTSVGWLDGDLTNKVVRFQLMNDTRAENTETFKVTVTTEST